MAITLNDVRFSYTNLFQPVARLGQDAKYSTTILVPKSNVAAKAAIDAAINEAINTGVAKCWNGQRPPMPAICVHDGDGARPSDGQPFGEECRGCWVFTASSKQPPFVVDANVQNIINPVDVYSGMWGNVSVNFFAYNSNGKKGIGCGLNGVQKTRDGEPLSGRVTAEEAFAAVASAIPQAAPAYGVAPGYPQTAAPAYPTAPAYTPAAVPVQQAYNPVAAPTYQQPVAAPMYAQPSIDPITGQPYAPAGMSVAGL
jgi:hypothetical protein